MQVNRAHTTLRIQPRYSGLDTRNHGKGACTTPHSGAVCIGVCHNGQVPRPVSQASRDEHASHRGERALGNHSSAHKGKLSKSLQHRPLKDGASCGVLTKQDCSTALAQFCYGWANSLSAGSSRAWHWYDLGHHRTNSKRKCHFNAQNVVSLWIRRLPALPVSHSARGVVHCPDVRVGTTALRQNFKSPTHSRLLCPK